MLKNVLAMNSRVDERIVLPPKLQPQLAVVGMRYDDLNRKPGNSGCLFVCCLGCQLQYRYLHFFASFELYH
jgi:hypothetical protein